MIKLPILRAVVVLLFYLFISHSELNGQLRPTVLLEDMDEYSLDLKCYCKPGVRNKTRSKGLAISYQFLTGGNIRSTDGKIGAPYPEYSQFRNFKSKISLPIIRKPQLSTVFSLAYQSEQYDLKDLENDFQGILSSTDNLNFKSSGFDLAFSYSTNETNYIGGKFGLRYNGSYNGLIKFSRRFAVYTGAIAYGIKKDEDNEWGFGVAGTKNFRRQGVRGLPFLFWNKTINDEWGFQISFPASYKLRYNLDAKTIFVLGSNYNGESYSFDEFTNQNEAVAFNHAEIITAFKVERQIVPWIWIDIYAGYHFNFDSDFELQESQTTILGIDPDSSILLRFGLFISPPDSFIHGDNRPPEVH